MDEKIQTIDLLIDGKIYRLSTMEPAYLSRVGAYLNSKIEECKAEKAYRGMDADYRRLLINLNIADDVFHFEQKLEAAQKKNEELEKELYGLRHDLVSTRMKLEAAQKEKEALLEQLTALKEKAENQGRQRDFGREKRR